jgi:hypothetical protein
MHSVERGDLIHETSLRFVGFSGPGPLRPAALIIQVSHEPAITSGCRPHRSEELPAQMRFIGEAACVRDSRDSPAILRDQSRGRSDAKPADLFANSGSEPAADSAREIYRMYTGTPRDVGDGKSWLPGSTKFQHRLFEPPRGTTSCGRSGTRGERRQEIEQIRIIGIE